MLSKITKNTIVKSCEYIEKGLCFQKGGLTCCVHGSLTSPYIITSEEIMNNKVSYDLIVERRKDLFLGLNKLKNIDIGDCAKCCNVITKKYKDVDFKNLGGGNLYLPHLIFNIILCVMKNVPIVFMQKTMISNLRNMILLKY